jgi:hypothetical protein
MAVGHQVDFTSLALGREGTTLSRLSVLAIFFKEQPPAAISKMRRTVLASLSFTLELHSALNSHVAITVAIASRVKPAQCKPFQAAMSLLPQLLYVERIHQRVDIKKHFRLLVL